jgi:hypothetical protein
MSILIHQLLAIIIMAGSVFGLMMNDVRFFSLEDILNFLFLLVVANIPACLFLRFIPIVCDRCKKYSLRNSDFLNIPRWAPQNYTCRNCGYACYQYMGKIHERNDA